MKVYSYDKNGFLIGEFDAYIDPGETKKQGKTIYMLPANATFEPPPKTNKNEIAVFQEGTWRIMANYLGELVCDKDFNMSTVDYYGDIKGGFVRITPEQAQKIAQDELFYIIKDNKLIINPNYEIQKAQSRKKEFEKEFFQTSLGWIRRKVNMKDGSQKDFLADLLLPIKAGLDLEQAVEVIVYKTPDFSQEFTASYILSLQERKKVTPGFIKECLAQVVKDFGG